MTWMVTCPFCSREVEEALTVRVDFGDRIDNVCPTCMSRGEEAADVEDDDAA
jgi:ribosome-binding protein aMBF1 (putative translation factor)